MYQTMKSWSLTRLLSVCILIAGISVFLSFSAKADTVCSHCGGTGKTTCYTCAGTGMKTCTSCSGTGMGMMKQVMISAGGMNPITGMFTPPQYSYVQERCILCGGAGRMFCTACSGGKILCTFCGGTGRVRSASGQQTEPEKTGESTFEPESEKETESGSEEPSPVKVKKGTVLEATDGVYDHEDAPNLLDAKKDTKFNVKSRTLYIIWKAPKLLRVSSYVITTGNDNAQYTGRNPRTWYLYGSNKKLSRNDKGWKKVHAVTKDTKLKDKNCTKYTYKLKSEAKPYLYYKLEVTDNCGSDCTQMTEFTLKGTAVTSNPTAIRSAKRSGTSLKVKWKKQSKVTGYQIVYSYTSSFKKKTTVKVKGASKTTTTIKLKNSKKVYAKIRTYTTVNGATVYSAWSKAFGSN